MLMSTGKCNIHRTFNYKERFLREEIGNVLFVFSTSNWNAPILNSKIHLLTIMSSSHFQMYPTSICTSTLIYTALAKSLQ